LSTCDLRDAGNTNGPPPSLLSVSAICITLINNNLL
jgi:hypothetical protein